MKKISDQEFSKLPLRGKGKSSAVYKAILSLHVGENLFIAKEENGRATKLLREFAVTS